MDSWKKQEETIELAFDLSEKFRKLEGLSENLSDFNQEILIKYENYLKNAKILDQDYIQYFMSTTYVALCEDNNPEHDDERKMFYKIIKENEVELIKNHTEEYEKIKSSFKKMFDEADVNSQEERQIKEDLIISNAAYQKMLLQFWGLD